VLASPPREPVGAGFESDRAARVDGVSSGDRALGERDTRPKGAVGPLNGAALDRALDRYVPSGASSDDVEATLARAIGEASAAGRFDVVALLAGELQARRLALGGVVALDAKRRPRGA
jgi:hypothetical protein